MEVSFPADNCQIPRIENGWRVSAGLSSLRGLTELSLVCECSRWIVAERAACLSIARQAFVQEQASSKQDLLSCERIESWHIRINEAYWYRNLEWGAHRYGVTANFKLVRNA